MMGKFNRSIEEKEVPFELSTYDKTQKKILKVNVETLKFFRLKKRELRCTAVLAADDCSKCP